VGKRYYPGAHPIHFRITGDTRDGKLLGAQLVERRGTEVSKRVDTYAIALYAGLTIEQINDLALLHPAPRIALGRRASRGAGMVECEYPAVGLVSRRQGQQTAPGAGDDQP